MFTLKTFHQPVLLKETIKGLDPKPGQNFIDGTLGGGGHAQMILEKTTFRPPNWERGGKLLGIDLDPKSIRYAQKKLRKFKSRVILVEDNFKNLKKIIDAFPQFNPTYGILLDLGISLYQLQDRSRGFSFQFKAPLNLAFGPKTEINIQKLLNRWSKFQIAQILSRYGEEKLANQIAEEIIKIRRKEKITNTQQLTEAVLRAYRKKLKSKKKIPWIGGRHPATKTFMALRIFVNQELENLKIFLPQAVEILAKGGRIAIISYHSGEDKVVKNFFRFNPHLQVLTKRPIRPSSEEIKNNPKARSAKLRIAQKI